MIPRIIYQTHEFDYDKLPSLGKESSSTWKNLNKGWEYVYMNSLVRKEYIFKNMPEIKKIYEYLPNEFKADIWRYLISYNNGGVYADMDSVCLKPLDDMLKNYSKNYDMICLNPVDGFINNSNFASVKHSYILNNILKQWRYFALHFDELKTTVLNSYIFNSTVTPVLFSKNVTYNKERVLFSMDDFAYHSLNFKFEGFNG